MVNKTKLFKRNFISKEILHMIVHANQKKISQISNKVQRKEVYRLSWTYSLMIVFAILISFVTLIFPIQTLQSRPIIFTFFEIVIFLVLAIDYSLRWYTADIQDGKGKLSFWVFPFKLLSIIFLIQMLPVLYVIDIQTASNDSTIWIILRIMKLTRIIRIIMVGTLVPFLTIFQVILNKNKNWLLFVFLLIILIVLAFGVGVYTAETSYYKKYNIPLQKEAITSYWDAIYYCVISITTIGFGDRIVVSNIGKFLTIVMAFLGIVILTFPSGILAGSFITEIKQMNKKDRALWTSTEEERKYGYPMPDYTKGKEGFGKDVATRNLQDKNAISEINKSKNNQKK